MYPQGGAVSGAVSRPQRCRGCAVSPTAGPRRRGPDYESPLVPLTDQPERSRLPGNPSRQSPPPPPACAPAPSLSRSRRRRILSAAEHHHHHHRRDQRLITVDNEQRALTPLLHLPPSPPTLARIYIISYWFFFFFFLLSLHSLSQLDFSLFYWSARSPRFPALSFLSSYAESTNFT